jgi:hypothetical protein
LAIEPLSNGGCGSYSMPSWIALATSALAICAANHSAMSIPADTPAAITHRGRWSTLTSSASPRVAARTNH